MEECSKQNSSSGVIGEVTTESSADKPALKCRILCSLLSASAQDLRSFDIEKERHDENSPKGVIEACQKDLESDVESPLKRNICMPSRPLSRWKKVLKRWKRKSVKSLKAIPSIPKISAKMGKYCGDNDMSTSHLNAHLCNMKASWKIFSLAELRRATNNFSPENMIGRGGFAEVYKGCLKTGELVAVKHLTRGTHEEVVKSFLSELGIIVHVDHPNTAKLIGYGVEGGVHIVLELSSLGSLASILYASREKLDWSIRYKIVLGTADGLLYLHEGCQRRIIHRDIKADNILLTENYEPQICDFGIAKWLPKQWTHYNVSKFDGTFGYFAPEYFMHGIVDEKTDVFAFGVLLLELITGRRALNDEGQSILLWAKPFLDEHDVRKLADPVLGDMFDEEEMDRVVLTASLCVQQTPILRPRMNQVVVLLRGDDEYCPTSMGNRNVSLRRTFSEELLDAKEYNSNRQLNQMRRHMQVAFATVH